MIKEGNVMRAIASMTAVKYRVLKNGTGIYSKVLS